MSMCAAVLAPPHLLYIRHHLLPYPRVGVRSCHSNSLSAATEAARAAIPIISVLSGLRIVAGWTLGVGLVSRAWHAGTD